MGNARDHELEEARTVAVARIAATRVLARILRTMALRPDDPRYSAQSVLADVTIGEFSVSEIVDKTVRGVVRERCTSKVLHWCALWARARDHYAYAALELLDEAADVETREDLERLTAELEVIHRRVKQAHARSLEAFNRSGRANTPAGPFVAARCPVCKSLDIEVRHTHDPADPTVASLLGATCRPCGWHFTVKREASSTTAKAIKAGATGADADVRELYVSMETGALLELRTAFLLDFEKNARARVFCLHRIGLIDEVLAGRGRMVH